MRLAEDRYDLEVGGELLTLRPTLRAAALLERREGGFPASLRGLADSHLGTIAAVIRSSIPNFKLSEFERVPLATFLSAATGRLIEYVAALAGINDQKPSGSGNGKTMPFAEYHARLFKIATGWLGWPPETAWNATPSEILAAYEGHLEMLRAVHGGEESNTPEKPEDAKRDRDGLLALKGLGGTA